MYDFTTFTREQYKDPTKMPGVLKKIGTETQLTDFAKVLGGVLDFSEYNSENLFGELGEALTSREAGVRPVFRASSCTDYLNAERDKNGILTVEYGEYPQNAAPKKLQRDLEWAYRLKLSSIKKTGKTYTTDSRTDYDHDKKFSEQKNDEFLYKDGKKYVRIKVKYSRYFFPNSGHKSELSNEVSYELGDYVWIEVQPIKWLIDEESDMAISQNVLFGGIQVKYQGIYDGDFRTTDMKKFMDNYFAKEIMPSLSNVKISEDVESPYQERINEIKELKNELIQQTMNYDSTTNDDEYDNLGKGSK